MGVHPELPDGVNDIISEINASQIILVPCHGCGVPRPINAAYAAHVTFITECRFCRSAGEQ